MYTVRNYRTKKQLREAVEHFNAARQLLPPERPTQEELEAMAVRYFQPNQLGPAATPPAHGTITLEGPHYPAPHTWYATARVENGVIVSVK